MNGVIYAKFSCDHQREESIEGQVRDIFVNAAYIMDDGIRFALNFFDGVDTIPLCEWEQAKGSDLLGYAPPQFAR